MFAHAIFTFKTDTVYNSLINLVIHVKMYIQCKHHINYRIDLLKWC